MSIKGMNITIIGVIFNGKNKHQNLNEMFYT